MLNVEFNQLTTLAGNKYKVLVCLLSKEFLQKTTSCDEKQNRSSLSIAVQDFNFSAKLNEGCIVSSDNKDQFSYTVVYGLGSENNFDPLTIEKTGKNLFDFLCKLKVKNATIIVNTEIKSDLLVDCSYEFHYKDLQHIATRLAFGMQVASYRYTKYLTGEKLAKALPSLTDVNFIVSDSMIAEENYQKKKLILDNMNFLRDLVYTPANELNPDSYSKLCIDLLKPLGIEVKIYGLKDLQKMKMNALIAVGQASVTEPRLIVMEWRGADNSAKPVAFVGKGVTYDSGGLSIKPSSCMDTMFVDMAGSGVVVALLKLLAERKAKVNAVGVIGVVENVIAGNAQRPGDIVVSRSGQTIEVKNTDAEGRMVLADALHYTQEIYQPQLMIDLATLTGAMCVALDSAYAGMFTRNEALSKELIGAGKKVNEEVWQMPLAALGESYDKKIDSAVADVANSVSIDRNGGAITAAQFLQRFTNSHPKWAHLDIAATAWLDHNGVFGRSGATGFGLRLLNQLIVDYYEDKPVNNN